MKVLYKNSIVSVGSKQRFRLINFVKGAQSPNGVDSWVAISLTENNPLPQVWPAGELSRRLSTGEVKVAGEATAKAPATPRAADVVIMMKRWDRIKDLVREDPGSRFVGRTHELWDRAKRAPLLKEHAEYLGVSTKTLFDDLRLYWTGGQRQEALLGSYWNCGRLDETSDGVVRVKVHGDEGSVVSVFAPGNGRARGRRPQWEDYEPFVMTSALRKNLIAHARKLYLEDERVSVRQVADEVVRKHFSQRDDAGKLLKAADGSAVLYPLGTRPTHDQVRYLISKSISPAESHRKRVGESQYFNNHAGAAGSVHDDCSGAGDVYEIDATVVDIHLVARHDRTAVIGCPTLYLVVDRATNLIVGFYASLESAKWEEAKQAVLSVCGDWEALCKRLNVKYIPEAFPARGIFPNRWVGDRGELLGFNSDILSSGLGQQVQNLPARQARRKCRVEGNFHTTAVVIKDNAPGYKLPRNARKRQGKKYEKDACLTFEEFLAIYLRQIMSHNLKASSSKFIAPEFRATKQMPSPVNLWNFDVERNVGALAFQPYESARRALMPVDKATVTRQGIVFKGLRYEFREAANLGWFSRASLRGEWQVQVAFSPNLVDTILIHDDSDSTRTYEGQLTKEYMNHFSGYSFPEVVGMEPQRQQSEKAWAEQRMAQRIAVSEDVEEISEPAYAEMKKKTKGMGLGTRISRGRGARSSETRERRKKMHDVTVVPASHVGGALDDLESESPAASQDTAPRSEGQGGQKAAPSNHVAELDAPEDVLGADVESDGGADLLAGLLGDIDSIGSPAN